MGGPYKTQNGVGFYTALDYTLVCRYEVTFFWLQIVLSLHIIINAIAVGAMQILHIVFTI